MKIVTAAEMREIDRITSEQFSVPSLTLMENAGTAVTEFVRSPGFLRVTTYGVICGKGNNGGDGFVIARLLHERGKEVRLLVLADPAELRGDAAENFKKLPAPSEAAPRFSIFQGLDAPGAEAVFASPMLIDAILGTGFRPPVSAEYAKAIAAMNASTAKVIAVDIPSGADADVMGEQTGAVARADAIVTFTAPRPAHIFGNLTSGPTVIAPIGSPEEAIRSSLNLNVITPHDIAPLIGSRPRDSNKGMYGHVLVVGGSLGKAGAAAMAGFSALRAGAGLVSVATPRSVLGTVAGFHPELMTEPMGETESGSISTQALGAFWHAAEGKTVLAIGPGISRHPETAEFVRTVIQKTVIQNASTPIVLDADGLNAFEGKSNLLNGRNRTLVLTPHPGEMARLSGLSIAAIQRDRINVARTFAKEHKLILVLKGDRTIVANPEGEAWVNTNGNPGMATGGTGDILTGMIAGMLAQNPKRSFEAVLAAVYLHGLAGDIAASSGEMNLGMGEHSLVATDLLKTLPQAFRQARALAAEKWVKIG
jgi:ADP-dependent NAD(P)H-hydrate dehydratase / NAD(P)H-hydrate epimerase